MAFCHKLSIRLSTNLEFVYVKNQFNFYIVEIWRCLSNEGFFCKVLHVNLWKIGFKAFVKCFDINAIMPLICYVLTNLSNISKHDLNVIDNCTVTFLFKKTMFLKFKKLYVCTKNS